MSIEDQISNLLAHADPLRLLHDDDPAKAPLAGIVDEINRLRAEQAAAAKEAPPTPPVAPQATEEGADAIAGGEFDLAELHASALSEPGALLPVIPPKRRVGRPKKDAP